MHIAVKIGHLIMDGITAVYRNGVKVSDGDILSASVLEVKPGDNVYWAFGTYDQAAAYFAKCK